MQPSFTFTSRQDWNNLAVGLDSIIKTQLVNSHAKTPFDINLETAFYPNNVLPPPNELEVLDVKTVLPICPPIYVQPSIAQGLTAVAIDDAAAQQITQVLSANNALKRGNTAAAEYLLKRPLTAEEIQNKTITPQVRQSNSGQNYAVGPRAGPQAITGQAFASQEKKFGDLDVRFQQIARKNNLDPAIIEATVNRYSSYKPNPRNSSEATAASWNQAIDAVEQEIKNQETAGTHHVDNSSMSGSASATLKARQEAAARNGEPVRGPQRETKEPERKDPYPGYSRDYSLINSPHEGLKVLHKYKFTPVPPNENNDSTHQWITQSGTNLADSANLQLIPHDATGYTLLKHYGLYAADTRYRNWSGYDTVVAELQRRADDIDAARMNVSEGPDDLPPPNPGEGDMDTRVALGGVPGLVVDANGDPEESKYDAESGEYVYGPSAPVPYERLAAGAQSALASGLGAPHSAPTGYQINLNDLPTISRSSLGPAYNVAALNLGAEEDTESDKKSNLLPSSLYEPISMLSFAKPGTTVTAATYPQSTLMKLNSQVGAIDLGGQPQEALASVIMTDVTDEFKNASQRMTDINNTDMNAARALNRQAGKRIPIGPSDKEYRINMLQNQLYLIREQINSIYNKNVDIRGHADELSNLHAEHNRLLAELNQVQGRWNPAQLDPHPDIPPPNSTSRGYGSPEENIDKELKHLSAQQQAMQGKPNTRAILLGVDARANELFRQALQFIAWRKRTGRKPFQWSFAGLQKAARSNRFAAPGHSLHGEVEFPSMPEHQRGANYGNTDPNNYIGKGKGVWHHLHHGPEDHELEGGDISGGRVERDPRRAKRVRLDEKSRTAGVIHVAGPGPNVTGISGFYGSTAPITSRLMHQTGRDAVPVSGQIQVNENHQWTEAPLRQYIRHPQVVEDLVAEYEPIAVNTQLRVERPKASSVFERGHYGKYLINHIALEGKRTFSVSYPSSKKKVRGLPNKLLSNNEYSAVKKVLSGGIISAGDKLTKEERVWMAGMHSKCGVPVHPGLMTKVKSGGSELIPGDPISGMKRGSGALANVDPKQQIMDILGEMDAGNDNPNLKRQLAAVAQGLFRRHQITPKLYAECKQHWT